jgi:hypothetical protein
VPFHEAHVISKNYHLVITDLVATFFFTKTDKFFELSLPGADVDPGADNHDLLALEVVYVQGQGCEGFTKPHVVCETLTICNTKLRIQDFDCFELVTVHPTERNSIPNHIRLHLIHLTISELNCLRVSLARKLKKLTGVTRAIGFWIQLGSLKFFNLVFETWET